MRILLTGLVGAFALFVFYSCQKEISLEYGTPAQGSLQGAGGACLPKNVAGSYIAAKSLNDSNFLEVTVDVLMPGPYTITTDTVNGFSFRTSGTFSATGATTVRLKGSGVPTNAGTANFIVTFDSTDCDVAITVLPAGSTPGPAVFTLDGSPAGCSAFDLTGNYYKDSTLDVRHSVKLNVNVTSVGTYTISTNPVNGYRFTYTGAFSATGPAQITLAATGKPLNAGTDNFTVSVAGSTETCTFPVTVTVFTPPAGGGCSPNVQGTYTAGTATAAANKVTLTHTYAAAGTYNVTVANQNGFGFGTQAVVATIPGPNTITLTAAGTPTTAGTTTFTVTFGDGQTCTFPVTVAPAAPVINTDYFPIAANNWWSYDYSGGAPDTMIMKVMGPQTIGGQTYQRFEWSESSIGPFADYFYRKDAATGFYYEGMDTTGFGPELTFTQSALDVNFLRNTLTNGQTWNVDFQVTANFPGVYTGPATLRFKYTCVNNNATVTTATGRTLTNVYEVHLVFQIGVAGVFQDAGDVIKTYYARGIGQVKYLNDADPADVYQETIRHWQVN